MSMGVGLQESGREGQLEGQYDKRHLEGTQQVTVDHFALSGPFTNGVSAECRVSRPNDG